VLSDATYKARCAPELFLALWTPRGLPQVSTALHQPSRRGVAKGVWRDLKHVAIACIAEESLVQRRVNRHAITIRRRTAA
jgi:hypothetical protein